jgi:hypothetical protein
MNNKPLRSQPPSIKLDQLVYVELESSNGGMMLTISEEGFTFRAVTPVRPTGRIPFSFIINGTEKLEGFGKIEWTEDDGKVGGLHFADVSTEFIDALRKWLARLNASGPLSFAEARSDRSNPGQQRSAELPQLLPSEPRMDTAKVPDIPVIESKLGASLQSHETHNGNGVPPAAPREIPVVGLPRPVVSEWSYPSVLQEPAPSRVHGATVAAVAIIFLVLAALLYVYRGGVGQSLISVGQKLSGAAESSESQQLKTPEPPKPAAETSQTPVPASPAPASPAPASPSKEPQPVAAQSGSAPNSDDRSENSSPAAKPDSAFTDARRPAVTPGESVPDSSNPADEVRALWSAVAQGNTSAEVTLARLYLIGGGVPKSCDQARVLLQAAARKGNGEAIDKLSQISRQGCP